MSHREPKSSEAGNLDSCVELGNGGTESTLTLLDPTRSRKVALELFYVCANFPRDTVTLRYDSGEIKAKLA